MKNSTLLKKIVILFLVIMLPLLLFGSISLFSTTHKLKNEFLHSHAAATQHHANTLDSNFEDIYDLSLSIFSRSEIKELTYTSHVLDQYEKNQCILQLKEYIRSVKNNSNLIQNIRIYLHTTQEYLLVSTGDSSYMSGSYIDGTANTATFQKITEDIFQFWAEYATEPINIILNNERLFLVLRPNQNDFSNILVTEYSFHELKKILAQYQQNENFYYLFNFRNGNYFLDNIPEEMRQTVLTSMNTEANGFFRFSFHNTQYYAFFSNFQNMDASYIQIIEESAFLKPTILANIYTTVFILLMILSIVLFFIFSIRIIHNPMTKLVNAFQTVENGDLSIRISDTSKSEFDYLYKSFNHMTEHLDSLVNEVYLQKILRQKSEFKQLQSQINPHFLYNSFFMLQRMIQSDLKEESIEVSSKLGLYFKYITRTQAEFVSLKDEYDFAKIYSDIQSIRFEGRISTQFGTLPIHCLHWTVPRLILQPIIENAYNYGLEDKCSDGLLKITFSENENGLFIIIEDNGENLSDEKLEEIQQTLIASDSEQDTHEITGLDNISRRLLLYSQKQSFLTVTRSNIGGLKVSIFLTMPKEDYNETLINH